MKLIFSLVSLYNILAFIYVASKLLDTTELNNETEIVGNLFVQRASINIKQKEKSDFSFFMGQWFFCRVCAIIIVERTDDHEVYY